MWNRIPSKRPKYLSAYTCRIARNREYYEDLYEESGLVFTDESGHRITPQAAYRAFKLVVTELGMPLVRFHDLRHSYAVASLRSGDDV